MTTQTVLTVFLASPGDVAPERDIVCKIVEEFNRTVGEAENVRVQVVRWETDARPGWGKDGQAIINQLIEKRDHAAFVVLFWNRFGTPTPRAPSGTIEEFKLALKKRLSRQRSGKRPPEIMLYFNTAPATLNTEKELDQRKAVLAFKASIKDGLYGTYRGKTAFEKNFRIDYGKWLMEEIAQLPKSGRATRRSKAIPIPSSTKPTRATSSAGTTSATRKTSTASSTRKNLIMLDNHFFHTREVRQNGQRWTVVITPKNERDDSKIRALCDTRWGRSQVACAFQLQGGLASIESGERHSDQKGDSWTVTLHFTPANRNAMVESSMNGLTAQEVAQRKAKWLLLGQRTEEAIAQNTWGTNQPYLDTFLYGGRDNPPLFPTLWKQFKSNPADFREAAKLYAVYHLLSKGICSEVTKMEIGTISKGRISVNFEGKRSNHYHGQAPLEIHVKGACALESS